MSWISGLMLSALAAASLGLGVDTGLSGAPDHFGVDSPARTRVETIVARPVESRDEREANTGAPFYIHKGPTGLCALIPTGAGSALQRSASTLHAV